MIERGVHHFVVAIDFGEQPGSEALFAFLKLNCAYKMSDSTWVLPAVSTAAQISEEVRRLLFEGQSVVVLKARGVGWFEFLAAQTRRP